MITLIEARNYRCLRAVSRPIGPFHILVGPNASGKTTFLDVVGFLRDIVSDGLDEALEKRTNNPEDLLFRRQGDRIELAVEARIPEHLRKLTAKPDMDRARYEVAIGYDETGRQFEFKEEKFLLKRGDANKTAPSQRTSFPMEVDERDSLITPAGKHQTRMIVHKRTGGKDFFHSETDSHLNDKYVPVWTSSFNFGPHKVALRNLPEDEELFPVAVWFREYLRSRVQLFVLNSLKIRYPSPPSRAQGFLPDGSNLAWVVDRLRREDEENYRAWIEHLQTVLGDLVDITTFERPEDRHRYLIYEYRDGLSVPSWLVSDGTLRLTALTLPAYLPDLRGMYLIEEPENGIHPGAVSAVYDSLSSMYEAQVLLATHSPVVLNEAKMEDVLCFAKDGQGATDIVLGSEHPMLREWRREVSLGTLLADEVLG